MADQAQVRVMAMRMELMQRLQLIVQTEGWTQSQVAERLGVAQSRVSDLLSSKSDVNDGLKTAKSGGVISGR